jgi:hypothetical protein
MWRCMRPTFTHNVPYHGAVHPSKRRFPKAMRGRIRTPKHLRAKSTEARFLFGEAFGVRARPRAAFARC